MKRWCIINLSRIRDAEISDYFPLDCEKIDKKYLPKFFYQNRDQAEQELFRLTEKYGEGFYLFEAVGKVIRSLADSRYYHLYHFKI